MGRYGNAERLVRSKGKDLEITIPDDMTWPEFRSHPIRQLLRDAAYFGSRAIPTNSELDELELPASATAELKALARHVAEVHDAGELQLAWTQADELAASALCDLAPVYRTPAADRGDKPDPLSNLGPADLAALVPPA